MRLLLACLALATPAVAQQAALPGAALPGAARPKAAAGPGEVSRNAPVGGVLVLYGNERCPTDNEGNEVVVCARRPAAERFRVPKELREFQVTPQNESWATRTPEALATGVGGGGAAIGSCSTIGPGGQTGCFAQAARANRATNKARAADQATTDRIVAGE